MIQFSEQIGFWSRFIFWFVLLSTFVSMAFVIVVTIGGLSDLRFLLRAIREEPRDFTDDGRITAPEKQGVSGQDEHVMSSQAAPSE